MREHPILFNDDMVRAILAGRKTQTRRVIKPQPTKRDNLNWVDAGEASFCNGTHEKAAKCKDNSVIKSPYGGPGDRLWVREAWCRDYHADGIFGYRADELNPDHKHTLKEIKWTPSIHMPRWASRILLEVTNVRVERVQDISREDVISEGLSSIEVELRGERLPIHKHAFENHKYAFENHKHAFAKLWDSINGKKPGRSWSANPWVWVIDFESETLFKNNNYELCKELEAKNAECREALKHEVDLNAMNLRQCEKLKAQLSKSQERVKELEDKIEGLNEDEFGRKL
jgi:hypothetical protein